MTPINWLNTTATSVSMAVDTMTVNATNGLKGIKVKMLLLIAFFFGLFQALMPTIGYFVGYSFREYLEAYIPWIAFTLLCLLGVKNFIDWLKEFRAKDKEGEEGKEEKKSITFRDIIVQSIATSIDALCIGFVYLENDIPSALIIFGTIGVITTALSFLTGVLAKQVAGKLERWGGLIAAIVFVLIGTKILLEGLGVINF